MSRMRNAVLLAAAASAALMVGNPARATVLVEYDAATGLAPDELPTPWQRFGVPMFNTGGVLLQDNTFDDPTTESGEYLSPSAGAGTMKLTSGQYGIEVRTRPLTDVPFLGGSHYANAYVFWSDDSFAYNITIDKDTDDGGPGTTGGIKYGQNSMSDAVTGIDWSTPHDIYVGYRSSAPFGVFDFYVDGVLTSSRSAGSMARSAGFPFAQDRVDFGDGTTGQGVDIAMEWYSLRIHDTAAPVILPSAWAVDGNGNWSTASNWTNGVPDALTGSPSATFGSIITAPRTVTLDAPHAIGHILFDSPQSYTVAGSPTLQFTTPGTASIDVTQGNHTMSVPLSMTSPTVATVAAGSTLTLSGPSIAVPGSTFTKSGDGRLELTHVRGYRFAVDAGTAAIIATGGGSNAGASNLTSLVINTGAGARLDLRDNKLITADAAGTASGGVYSGVQGDVQRAYAFGAWDQSGLTTSMPDAVAGLTTIGVATGEQVRGLGPTDTDTFAGQTITGASSIAMYTYAGDANLDGTIDGGDYGIIDNFVQVPNADGYANGDFNYDGVIDGGDYGIIDNNVQAQGAPFPTSSAAAGLAAGVTAIPEPSACAFAILAAAAGVGSRRRRRS